MQDVALIAHHRLLNTEELRQQVLVCKSIYGDSIER